MSSTLQLIGLGVDDMYIVLLALKKEKDFTEKGFLRGMQEVVVPVSMTSFVNASMFAVMNSKFWFPIFFFVLSFQLTRRKSCVSSSDMTWALGHD